MKPPEYFYDRFTRGEGHFSLWLITVLKPIGILLFKLAFRYRVVNPELHKNLPSEQGYIVVGNHRSYLDPVFVILTLLPRLPRFIAKEEFFNSGFLAFLAARAGAFPLKRNSADKTAIKRAVKMLKRGELVGIFPEGTRIRFKEQVPVYHEGVALIAHLSGAPVLPVHITGAEKICPEGKRFFRCPSITLRYGEPLSITEEAFASLPKEERFAAFTNEIMARVAALGEPDNEPQAPAAAPTAPDAAL
ncbi:MAG: 1-acyl-sn-glycerol-3-phosphate acyltransferase [Coriobacteriales bacterium]|jgi:1-acyl-sn-glycerol-3-phosphate acyltransferase|nr:1-acyl-sn-glycerol-3-phosphate acyltransferase [Coriobacteriales bacterium]